LEAAKYAGPDDEYFILRKGAQAKGMRGMLYVGYSLGIEDVGSEITLGLKIEGRQKLGHYISGLHIFTYYPGRSGKYYTDKSWKTYTGIK
jgi:hypothetical protein